MKNVIAERVEVWAASIQDQPGGLAKVLRGLRDAGADLELIIARRARRSREPASCSWPRCVATRRLRLRRCWASMSPAAFNRSVLKEITNPAIASEMADKLAAAGVNLRGLTAAVMGTKFIMYIGLDNAADAARVVDLLRQD